MFSPKLGVSLHTIATELTEETLAAVGASAIATLEVAPRLFENDRSGALRTALKGMCRTRDTCVASVHILFGGAYDLSSLDPAVRGQGRQAFDDALALADELDAGLLIVHASAEPVEPDERALRLARVREALQSLAPECKTRGKRIAVELLPRTCLGNTVEELFAILDGLPADTCGVCLDVNHLMDRYAELPEVVRRLGDTLVALHLSDYDGVDEKHWTPGLGVIDWPAFLQALRDTDYRGPFNYESKLDGETPGERIQAVTANFEWLRGLLR